MVKRKYSKHEAKVIFLTPKHAKKLYDLGKKHKQRPIRPHRVEELKDAMRRNLWEWTGESIVLDYDGIPRNGMHRLKAVIDLAKEKKSFSGIETTISRGVKPSVFKVIDTHSKRSLRDVLKIDEEAYANNLATALNIFDQYQHGCFRDGRRIGFQRQDAFNLLKEHPDLRRYAANSDCFSKRKILPASMVAAFHYIFVINGKKRKADIFFEKLLTSEGLFSPHPIYCFRELLRETRIATKKEKMALLVKTWNAFLRGESINSLTYRDSKHPRESFPKVEGTVPYDELKS